MSLVLKEYKKVDTDKGQGLQCPRRLCGGKFIVNYGKVLDKKLGTREAPRRDATKTIVCPYCSKVSAIPEDDLAERGFGPCRHTDGYKGE